MLKITIKEINPNNSVDVNQCDKDFLIDSKIVLHFDNEDIRYSILPMIAEAGSYATEDIDVSEYINAQDKIIYLAYLDSMIAGQIILRKNWNNYAYIEDISVDSQARRQGIGKMLIDQAETWARTQRLAGITLETQDNNVAACMFYESCGFKLGGFDAYLYKGSNPSQDQIALFWYLLF